MMRRKYHWCMSHILRRITMRSTEKLLSRVSTYWYGDTLLLDIGIEP